MLEKSVTTTATKKLNRFMIIRLLLLSIPIPIPLPRPTPEQWMATTTATTTTAKKPNRFMIIQSLSIRIPVPILLPLPRPRPLLSWMIPMGLIQPIQPAATASAAATALRQDADMARTNPLPW